MSKKIYIFEECEEKLNSNGWPDYWQTEEDDDSVTCVEDTFIRIPDLNIDVYDGAVCYKKYYLNGKLKKQKPKRVAQDDDLRIELENNYDVTVICKIGTREILSIEGGSFKDTVIEHYTGKSPKGLICELHEQE